MTSFAIIELSQDGQTLSCAGEWTLSGIKVLPSRVAILPSDRDLYLDAAKISNLDTVGAFRLHQFINDFKAAGKKVILSGLNAKHQVIFALVESKLKMFKFDAVVSPKTHSLLEVLGRWGVSKYNNTLFFLAFLGEIVLQFCKMRAHGAQNLWLSGLKIIQTAGCQALPIVATMSFLIGIVLAYQLGMQLKIYGADIYVVEASGIAILREFAPLMTSVLIAGRTSTAFAALIGAMKVNNELDALTTMGVSTVERIVLPRIVGLMIVLPLLVIWSDIFSVLGSMIMAKSQSAIGYRAFLERFGEEVYLRHYVLGLVKTPVFAFIIATVGCFQGFQAGITADSVGVKTTAAAVQAIFLIIVADAFFSVLFSWRGL